MTRKLLISLGLVVLVLAIYGQTGGHPFINFDDVDYVTNNSRVRQGLSWENAAWAFTATDVANWHPLTWLSHMADVELFGLDPGKHHLVNVLFHAANAVVLFLALNAMTGAPWRSGVAAALFAVHPLHVESVAWISERKDLLCAFFFLLAILAHVRAAARGGRARHALVSLFAALALLAKPMAVTLPFILLILDYWPLGRWDPPAGLRRLLLEKVPLFAMSLGSCLATFVVQESGGAVNPYPLAIRLGNAIVSYAEYLRKTAWPDDLSIFYPHPGTLAGLSPWKIGASILLLGGITALSLRVRKRRPWVVAGWAWYVGMLVPVIGLVQVGRQALADRYTYLPLIGVFVAVAWSAHEAVARRRRRVPALAAAGAAAIVAFSAASWVQVSYWRDHGVLFDHALKVTPNNWLAHDILGLILFRQGQTEEASVHFVEALRINPELEDIWNNMGIILMRQGRSAEAMSCYREALRVFPDYALAFVNMGNLYLAQGDEERAAWHYGEALRRNPDIAEARYNLGSVLAARGRNGEAILQYREALRIKPDYANAHNNLGNALLQQGKVDEAVAHFREALRLNPQDALAKRNLEAALGARR